jgi:hypothetical protein
MTSSACKTTVLALALLLASGLTACGFSDELTTRGFIKEGDQICIDTLVRAGVGLNAKPNVSGSRFLATLASAYGAAAARFRHLEVRSDDEPMRDRIVAGYSSFARRFHAAAQSPAGAAEARAIFADVSSLQRAVRAYGFQVCGGGGAPG